MWKQILKSVYKPCTILEHLLLTTRIVQPEICSKILSAVLFVYHIVHEWYVLVPSMYMSKLAQVRSQDGCKQISTARLS